MTKIGELPPRFLTDFQHLLGATRIETHISWLLLAEGFAYKIKKPVKLAFVDYGSAEKRHFFCQEELRLNRRYAPALYLDVVPIADSEEWAVKMRRFDEAGRLDHLCQRGGLTPAHLSDLARAIVAFHQSAAVATPGMRFGAPEQVLAAALENFEELHALLPEERPHLQQLREWTSGEFIALREAMASRKQAGCIRECHGDLHLGNLVLLDGRVVPFDCVEFNEDLRWIDVASELAFTYVDLLHHQQPGLATWLLNEWLRYSGDFAALSVLRFYAVYRALVRAKVSALSRNPASATEYLRMAESLIAPPAARLTITFGLSGAGKTTRSTAMLLADRSAATVRIRSDIERKRLYGLGAEAASHSRLADGIYSTEASTRTYARLAELASAMLVAGWSVIVDATFLRRAERDVFRSLATAKGASFSILGCSADGEELRRRLAQRSGDASEATVAVLERQIDLLEPLGRDELLELTEA